MFPCHAGPVQNLETARLILRPWRHDDAPRLLDLQSRIEVMKWLGDGEPQQGVVEKWYVGPSELFRITAEEWAAGQHP